MLPMVMGRIGRSCLLELWANGKSLQQRGMANMVPFALSSVGSSTVSTPVTYWPLSQLFRL